MLDKTKINWKRIVAKEWLIILGILFFTFLIGLGLYFYRFYDYKKLEKKCEAIEIKEQIFSSIEEALEADRLGLLPPEKKSIIEELKRRGEIKESEINKKSPSSFDSEKFLKEMELRKQKSDCEYKLSFKHKTEGEEMLLSVLFTPPIWILLTLGRFTFWSLKKVREKNG